MKPLEPGQIILQQLGVWVRGCLDIKGKFCRLTENGVRITGCLISTGPNRRGNISITLTPADLYDVTFNSRTGDELHEGLYADQMVALMRKKAGL